MPKDVLRIGDVITVFDLRPCEVRVPSQTRYLGKRKKERPQKQIHETYWNNCQI